MMYVRGRSQLCGADPSRVTSQLGQSQTYTGYPNTFPIPTIGTMVVRLCLGGSQLRHVSHQLSTGI